MINGLTRSSAYDIKKSQITHFNKLKNIITSNSTILGFATDHSQISRDQGKRIYSNPALQMLVSKRNHVLIGLCRIGQEVSDNWVGFLSYFRNEEPNKKLE